MMKIEVEDVRFQEISEMVIQDKRIVRIQGFSLHSSLAVKDIKSQRNGNDIVVEIYLSPVGLSGNFTIEVPIDNSIKRILFGTSKTEIWSASDVTN